MTDKVQKIKDWISKEQDGFIDANGNFEYPEHEGAYYILCNLDAYIDSLQEEPVSEKKCMFTKDSYTDEDRRVLCEDCKEKCEFNKEEPVSEDLGKYINKLSKQFPEVSFAKLSRIAVRVAKWQKSNLWKPADGDDLPEIDREVIAILDYDFGHYKAVYAHRPDPNGWDGTNIDTGEKEHFEPEIYDKGGWNQPHVLYWLDVKLPKEIEL